MTKLFQSWRVDGRDLVREPGYQLTYTSIGVVHIGPGAFHRAHQAVYFDEILTRFPNWAICAVSLKSNKVKEALSKQNNLYTVMLCGETTEFRVIGSLKELLTLNSDWDVIKLRLTSQATKVITLTITEKGYCLNGAGYLDLSSPNIQADLVRRSEPKTAIGVIAEALRIRRSSGSGPVTIISCDNLPKNGELLCNALITYVEQYDRDLADWIDETCTFPSTMVDCITPATTETLKQEIALRTGNNDAWPIQREAFSQWIIEDKFASDRPPVDEAGAIFVDDVVPYETAKLRLLNGAHSALAYLGLLLGKRTVVEAISDGSLGQYIRRFMNEEVRPHLGATKNLDLSQYIESILTRFSNRSIDYLLVQIASDSSKKIPVRLFPTFHDAVGSQGACRLTALAIAAWMVLIRISVNRLPFSDPLEEKLIQLSKRMSGDFTHDVALTLSLSDLFPQALYLRKEFRIPLETAYRDLGSGSESDVRAALREYTM